MMVTGDRIRNTREDMDILQQELADAVGINVSVLSRIEKGTRQIRDDELVKIANKLNVSTDYLLGNDAPSPGYYDDQEVAEMANRLKDDPNMKILFDASKKLSKDDLQFVIDMVHRMKKE